MHPFLTLLAELIRDPSERNYFCAQVFYAIKFQDFNDPRFIETEVNVPGVGVCIKCPVPFHVAQFIIEGRKFFSSFDNLVCIRNQFGVSSHGEWAFKESQKIIGALFPPSAPQRNDEPEVDLIALALATFKAANKAALKQLKDDIRKAVLNEK